MIKCPNCGFGNDDNCTFCAICGSSVTQDDFYVHNTTGIDFSVEELTKKLISKDKRENAKTKSFKKLDKATIAKEAATIESTNEKLKEYRSSSNGESNTYKIVDNEENTPKIKTLPEIKNINNNQKPKNLTNKENNTENSKDNNSFVTYSKETIVNKKGNIDNNNQKENQRVIDNIKTDIIKETNVKNNPEDKKTDEGIEKAKAEVKSEEKTISTENYQNGKLYKLLSQFFFDTKDETKLFNREDIDKNCNFAIISYIPFLFFVPMIIKPCSAYLRYHGIQGLTMFLSFIIFEFFDIILSAICNSIFNDMVGMILTVIITVAINIAVLLLISIGIANAVKGAARELPIIGKYKFLKPYLY